MKRLILMLVAVALVGVTAAGSALAFGGGGHGLKLRWEVTVTNLTPATGAGASQPLSPPVVVVHNRRVDVWQPGAAASDGVAAVAEDANNPVLEGMLSGAPGVKSAFTAPTGGPILPGASVSFFVDSDLRHNRLSLLAMLVNTNDAFTGVDSLPLLPFGLFGKTFYVRAYDAGSEKNNELKTHIPGPCCGNPGVRDPEGGVIGHHSGITGAGDLDPATYGWEGAVAKIQIRPAFHR